MIIPEQKCRGKENGEDKKQTGQRHGLITKY